MQALEWHFEIEASHDSGTRDHCFQSELWIWELTVYEKWEVLLGVWLKGTTCWCGLSKHQAATAQMHLVENDNHRRVPTPLRSTSPFSDRIKRRELQYCAGGHEPHHVYIYIYI